MSEPRFIVGEISKNWVDGRECAPTGPLCAQFEHMINVNDRRGFALHSFQMHRVLTHDGDGRQRNDCRGIRATG